MSFEILRPGGAASLGAHFGYSVHSRGDGSQSLRITISGAVVAEAGWDAATRLRLEIDKKKKLARLVAVAAGADQARKLEVGPITGRGLFHFPFSGGILKHFSAWDGIYELDVVTIVSGEGVTFDLPEMDEEGAV